MHRKYTYYVWYMVRDPGVRKIMLTKSNEQQQKKKAHSTRQQRKKTTKTTATVKPKHINAEKNSGIASTACVRATLRNVIMCGRCVLFFLLLSNVSGRLQIFSCTYKII